MKTLPNANQITARRFLAFALLLIGPVIAACAFAPSSWTGEPNPIAGWNAVYNCPTLTPTPTPYVPPTECVPGPTPENFLTPAPPPVCTTPVPIPTALPSPTPYGRWASPGDRGSSNIFRRGQQIYIGPLRLTLQSYRRVPIPANNSEAHVWTLDVRNVSANTTYQHYLAAPDHHARGDGCGRHHPAPGTGSSRSQRTGDWPAIHHSIRSRASIRPAQNSRSGGD